jgi:NAD(P)-dependent dehydrogenase (short-subunit alcohol dehydrogenase family)
MIPIDLSGMSALVTGGANGIGLACVRALRAAGARTVSLDPGSAAADGADTEITGDVTDPDSRLRALHALGDGPSALVNNAALQLEKRIGDTTADEARRLFDVNVLGVISLTSEFAAQAADPRAVVNMASVLALTGDPALGVYTATKGAVLNLTRTLALDYAGRIRVNAVLPGAIRTPLTTRAWDSTGDAEGAERRMSAVYPAGRIGEPEEVGPLVAFLLSEHARFISGAMITVDGGLLAANAEWALERL